MVNRWHQTLATLEGYRDSTISCAVWPVSHLGALQAVVKIRALYGLVGLFLPSRPHLRMLSERQLV